LEWHFASISRMREGIRSGAISCYELMQAHLAQLRKWNPALNAVVASTTKQALAQAKAADKQHKNGVVLGPLHGIPMTLKDSLDTKGVITTGGITDYVTRVPSTDATVVSRLKQAGAILIGKTNTPPLTLSFETENPIYGATNNPYDLARTPGGSSGGAAAAVASGIAPFDLGSDTGGSIRQPAHNCGIVGLKPTSGRVPRTGHLISFDSHIDALTQIGPMARYVEDIDLLMPLIAGPDGRDPSIAPVPWPAYEKVDISTLRIGHFTHNGEVEARQDVSRVVQAAVTVCQRRGARVTESCPPEAAQADGLFDALFQIDDHAWIYRMLPAYQQEELTSHQDAADATLLLADWQRFKANMLAFMDDFDALICPVFTHPAMLHGSVKEQELGCGYGFVNLFNLAGWPAIVVRCGASTEGLPIGVQIAAKPWREDILLAIAKTLEGEFQGWKAPSEKVL
jgi:amidase